MPRGDQLARQWKIIQTLITSRRGKSAADLAEELECHPRTLYRDLEALQVEGTEEIKFWVMSWGSNAEVLKPQSLREEIRAESEALLGKYGGGLLTEEKPSVA
jgi:predicted DNA-binding transcriptional regulator YafY